MRERDRVYLGFEFFERVLDIGILCRPVNVDNLFLLLFFYER